MTQAITPTVTKHWYFSTKLARKQQKLCKELYINM